MKRKRGHSPLPVVLAALAIDACAMGATSVGLILYVLAWRAWVR